MTRTNGATDAQIEAATYQYLQTCGPVETEVYAEAEQVVRHVAFGLVTTDHRIVRVDDLRALIEHTVWRDDDHEGHAALSRIVDLIGEAE